MLVPTPFFFQRATSTMDEASSTPTGDELGVTISAGANNTMGSVVKVLGPVAHDTHLLELLFGGFNGNSIATDTLVDVFIDPAGGTSWDLQIVESLMVGYAIGIGQNTARPAQAPFLFPIWLPAGCTLGARAQTAHTANRDGKCIAVSYGNPSSPGQWWCGRRVETLGVSRSTGKGAPLTPGNSSSWSSWVDIGNPTTQRWGALQYSVHGAGASMSGGAGLLEIGVGSTKLPSIPRGWWKTTGSEELVVLRPASPLWCDIASGTQLRARAAWNTTGAQENSIGLYGVY